jgi:hypothetical protein
MLLISIGGIGEYISLKTLHIMRQLIHRGMGLFIQKLKRIPITKSDKEININDIRVPNQKGVKSFYIFCQHLLENVQYQESCTSNPKKDWWGP